MRVSAISSIKFDSNTQPRENEQKEYIQEYTEHPKRLSLWQRVLNVIRSDDEEVTKQQLEVMV